MAILSYKVYIGLRWESVRELRFTAWVRDGKIAESDDVHSDQYIGTMGNDSFNDTNAQTLYTIWQLDIDQERSDPVSASNMVRVGKS